MLRWLRFGRAAEPVGPAIPPEDLWSAFEYVAGEYEATAVLRDDLLDRLGASFARQTGQARFDLQCKLAALLADRGSLRFHAALRLATQVPVPQARTVLLEMLTVPGLARWQADSSSGIKEPGKDSSANGARQHGPRPGSRVPRTVAPEPQAGCATGLDGPHHDLQRYDLRPAVIAALGQLRDPSLLGLFHRLLEKLAGGPAANQSLTAAVQWSLMNLAPGGQAEPVPAAILSGRPPAARDCHGEPVSSAEAGAAAPASGEVDLQSLFINGG
jgi:hypothetical protein